MKNHILLKRLGRYAIIQRKTETPEYVVCCGYDDKTGEWGAGFYFDTLSDAMSDYNERTSWHCRDCVNCNKENHPTWCLR